MISLTCRIEKDMIKMKFCTKQKQIHRLREQIYAFWGKGQRTVRELGMNKNTLLNLKLVSNKDLLYSTWNSAQCYMWQSRREGSLEENDTYTYIYMYG